MVERRDQDAAVWRRAKQEMAEGAAANGTPCRPEPLVLAAYLEGRADEDERRQVELWLAGDPEAPALLRAMTPLPEAVAAPDAVIARAQAIVRAPVTEKARGSKWSARLGNFFPTIGFQWSAVAAVMLLVAVAGFEAGRSGGTALTTSTDYVGLSAAFGEPDDALL